ncbi:glycosyltransferase [Aquipseudomonas campi]|uniref:Glycosyltransferase n=1 Tax=Aquipseudomonas campi TaxID=2731681 RepID=A0A6M8FB10_9GAMM|nr:glycosyltransferase [Pseudomonas campi]QKE63353.1 glycosyltransferase [Pseudomonas campi]
MPFDPIARTSVVILTLDAQRYLPALLTAIGGLPQAPQRVLFIDSASRDQTVALALAAGHQVHGIQRSDFGHGKTRNLALQLCADSEFLVYLTQDACPRGENWLAQLLQPFTDEQVALVYGRQLPRAEATLSERFAREFNYSAQADRSTLADLPVRGIKAVFCSNSFSAYRRAALVAVGGFPEKLPLGEDMAVALRLLQQGHARCYQPLAQAVHSHDYSVLQELKRYFDIGTLMAMDDELRRVRLAASGEGLRFVRAELAVAWQQSALAELCRIVLRTLGKYFGFALGQRYQHLPMSWRRRLSMHAFFWSES